MECKFTSSPMPLEEYTDLVNATKAFPNIEEIYLYFVSKSWIYGTSKTTSRNRLCNSVNDLMIYLSNLYIVN